MKKNFLLAFILLGSVASVSAQNVKYKDLFILLNARNYSDGGPYLRMILAEDREHPNANYHMGCMLQAQLENMNILTESEDYALVADSSVLFLKQSLNLITEKEVKKHDKDYYADYKRRDMRTGKFETKLSDVQLDIEQRIELVQKNKENSLMLSDLVNNAELQYNWCQQEYGAIANQFESLSELQIMADETFIDRLLFLMATYDSSLNNINQYAEIVKNDGLLTVNEISNFKIDGLDNTDFYGESITYWDYKKWAGKNIKAINEEIIPLKQQLISYDAKINELYTKLAEDSIDVRSEVFALATESVARDLRAYDEHALPLTIFNLRIAEINYLSTYYNWLNEVLDSADVGLKIVVLDDLNNQIISLETLFDEVKSYDPEKTALKYSQFINKRYKSYDELLSFFENKKPILIEQKEYILAESNKAFEADKWGIWQNDSIPLIVRDEPVQRDSAIHYSTSIVELIDTRTVAVYGFWTRGDETGLYTAIVPSSRQLEDIKLIPLDSTFGKFDVSQIDILNLTLTSGARIWAASVPSNDGLSACTTQIVMLTEESDIKWSNKFRLAEFPISIDYDTNDQFHSVMGSSQSVLLKLDEFGDNKLESLPVSNNSDYQKKLVRPNESEPSDSTNIEGLGEDAHR